MNYLSLLLLLSGCGTMPVSPDMSVYSCNRRDTGETIWYTTYDSVKPSYPCDPRPLRRLDNLDVYEESQQ